MRGTKAHVHPGLIENFKASGHFQDRITIQTKGLPQRNSVGEVTTPWIDQEVFLCEIGAPRASMQGREFTTEMGVAYEASHVAYLDDYAPGITVDDHRAVFNGKVMNIKAVGHSEGNAFTWIALEES